jgi:hypothetical protein
MTIMTTPRAGEPARSFPFSPSASAKAGRVAPAPEPVAAIRVTGEADPNILARIIQPMVKLDLLPRAMSVISASAEELVAEIAFAAADSDQVRRLENSLRAVIGVTSVEVLG